MRGQTWPPGSSGLPQNRQGGRPAATQLGGVRGEGGRLGPFELEVDGAVVLERLWVGFALLVDGHDLLDLDDEAVDLVVVGDADGAHHELGQQRRGGLQRTRVGGHRRGQAAQKPAEVLTEGVDLALLALQGDDGRAAAHLEVEHSLAGRSFGGRREGVDVLEPVLLAHRRHPLLVMTA